MASGRFHKDPPLMDSEADLHHHITYNMRTSLDMDHEGCDLKPGKKESLEECGFNVTAKTIFIIHGFTMSGILESPMLELVSAVMERESQANVVVVDWLSLAHQSVVHYYLVVKQAYRVGLSIATLLNWLEEEKQLSLQKVHLIGYSVGAHVAGYAGQNVRGTIGRITGLDPAGPGFEGVEERKRLSPDDADFVDVLHTSRTAYILAAIGGSIGIQQPIGDIDIYPNGDDVQPGCTAAWFSWMWCEHARAVHLFVDSLRNKDHLSIAYQCSSYDRFKKGMCLSCSKWNDCNIGYNAKKIRLDSKMYLKTRADTPFGGYHYQMKMHVFNTKQANNAGPRFQVKLYGTHKFSENMIVDVEGLTTLAPTMDYPPLNLTNTFLVFTEDDIGDLLKIQLSWRDAVDFWSWFTWPDILEVRRIFVRAGETQKKFTFCAEDPAKTKISPGEAITYVKCRNGWEIKPSKRLHK